MKFLEPPPTHDLFIGSRTDPANFVSPDLVLIQTPGWGVRTPPLSLATLTAFIRSKGYKVLPLDINLELFVSKREPFQNVWNDNEAEWFWQTDSCARAFIAGHDDIINAHIECLIGTGAKLFGFSCYSSCIHLSMHYAKELKKRRPDSVVIFGGPHASRHLSGLELARREVVDLVAQGEGELILLDVVERVARGEAIAGIPGTLHRVGGEVVDNGDRELIRDLDVLPFAALEDYAFRHYTSESRLPVMASRGCPNKCNYCSEKVYWGTYRGFSPQRVADEVFHQLHLYPHIWEVEFVDSLINGVMSRLMEMARILAAHPRKFYWYAQAVIRKEMTLEVFQKLAASGCKCLAFGLETSDPDLMVRSGKVLAKGTDVDELVENAHRAGMHCAYNFMFGLPGETAENAAASLDFLRRHEKTINTVNPSASFCGFSPGTPAYETPAKFGIVTDPEGVIYWETADGTNNLLVRMERFEAFCKLAVDLGISTTYPHAQLLDRNRLIANYYRHHKRYAEAVPYYDLWLKDNPRDEHARTARIMCAVQSGTGWRKAPDWAVRILRRAAGVARNMSARFNL